MFKNILIPTDGSTVANKAVRAGMRLAKQLGARVTGYCAVQSVSPDVFGEGYMLSEKKVCRDCEQRARETGARRIEAMSKVAAKTRVRFKGVVSIEETPYDGIIHAAKRNKCDAIFMASHGRRGLADMVLGSVTQKVLSHSKIPVLVYR